MLDSLFILVQMISLTVLLTWAVRAGRQGWHRYTARDGEGAEHVVA
jgi:hypothetical protein